MNYDNKALKYHYKASKGWMNDPNGLVWFDGYYHVFYQHAPDHIRPWKEPFIWGHARTKDFREWEELPLALTAGEGESCDNFGCWSGTALVHDGVLYLFYASVYSSETIDAFQTVSVAYSKDGVNFKKYDGNPIIGHYPADGCHDFRDPAILQDGEDFYIAMASANEEHTAGRLLLYKSRDLLDWEYKGILAEWKGCKYCECPSFLKLPDGKYLLTASVEDNETQKKHFYVMYGDFDGEHFTPIYKGEPQMGPDQYAGQVFLDKKGRAILMSWIPGWHYSYFADACMGCISLPMELTFDGGTVRAYPVEECRDLLKDGDELIELTPTGFKIKREREPDVVCDMPIKDLKVLRDEYILEIFVNHGEKVFSVVIC